MLDPFTIDRMRDEMTVSLCEATSPAEVLERVRAETRLGTAVYDTWVPGQAPRLYCSAGCGQEVLYRGRGRPWCSDRCRRQARRMAA